MTTDFMKPHSPKCAERAYRAAGYFQETMPNCDCGQHDRSFLNDEERLEVVQGMLSRDMNFNSDVPEEVGLDKCAAEYTGDQLMQFMTDNEVHIVRVGRGHDLEIYSDRTFLFQCVTNRFGVQ